jgi:hypothetical protein
MRFGIFIILELKYAVEISGCCSITTNEFGGSRRNLMSSAIQEGVQLDRRKATREEMKDSAWILFLVIITLILIAGFFIFSSEKYFKSGDDIGYNLGLVGGIMLLTLLLYPLRKRVRMLRSFGLLPGWFKWHMVLGIVAPTIILFHATFQIKSVNAGVALICMFLVSGSGSFGRFFYSKIHHGLYGRQATVNEINAHLEHSGDVKSTFDFAPNIEKKLVEFRDKSEKNSQAGKLGLVKFVVIGIQAKNLSRSLVKELHETLLAQARVNNSSAQISTMEAKFAEHKELIISYLKAVRDASQFHTYERLFSYWHIFHIPLVYMMVFSGFYHVYAVHAY